MAAAGALLVAVAWSVLKLGRKLPVKRFLMTAVIIVMFSSIAVLGSAMRSLQEAAVIDLHVLDGWPNLPIYLAQATGYYPTLPSVSAQIALFAIYVAGGVATYGFAARRKAAAAPRVADAPAVSTGAAATGAAATDVGSTGVGATGVGADAVAPVNAPVTR
jgi:high-affinity iron transporter